MKRLLFLLLTGLFAQLVVSCYPEGADNVDELDVAITNYDKAADFKTYTTYSMPDSIVYFTNDKSSAIDREFDQMILSQIQQKFTGLGYTLVDNPATPAQAGETPSFMVLVSAVSNVNYNYFVDNWYNNWNWYWGYWNWNWSGSFYPYYPWYPISVYSYRTGSVVIEMVDTKVRQDSKINVVWTGIADGLLQGSKESILKRTEKEINQCFTQSPYLGK